MTITDYQLQAMDTCMESCGNEAYMLLNLVAEVGELAGKVAKNIRHKTMKIDNNYLIYPEQGAEMVAEMRKEAGDVLWQLSGLCAVMGWNLDDVAKENLAKLAARKAAGTIDGNGDGITGETRKKA